MSDFINLKDLIPKAVRRFGMQREVRSAKACERFRKLLPELVGQEAPSHVRPKFLKGHILYVSVPSSIWAQKVFVKRHDLLEQINAGLEKPYVHDLRTLVEV
jgi:hypothetical protein